jgi:hypothetical protein
MLLLDKAIMDDKKHDIEMYFSSGFVDFDDFFAHAPWHRVNIYETDPDAVWTGSRQISNGDRQERIHAKHRLLCDGCSLFRGNAFNYLEFGVWGGTSLRAVAGWSKNSDDRFYGFDTFEGLPDGWVPMHGNRGVLQRPMPTGFFKVDAMPEFSDPRVTLLKGVFQDTLLPLIDDEPMRRALKQRPNFVNVDSDTYTAALFVLTALHPFLKQGDLVYFDEFCDIINEFAAFNDYVRSYYLKERFTLIARAYDGFLFRFD